MIQDAFYAFYIFWLKFQAVLERTDLNGEAIRIYLPRYNIFLVALHELYVGPDFINIKIQLTRDNKNHSQLCPKYAAFSKYILVSLVTNE